MASLSTALRDNKDVFDTVEFERWIGRTDLSADERYVLTQYLQSTAKTLEAGTAGGRILFALRRMGFADLHGFDFVPRLIEEARASDSDRAMTFGVQNAVDLNYSDDAFDQLIYLQQILCFLDDSARTRAVREAFRVLRPGGVALFSALSFEVRRSSPIYRLLMTYWQFLRWIQRSPLSIQDTPWMKLGGRFNTAALLDRGPYVHWFRAEEFLAQFQSAGFQIEAVGSSRQISAGRLCASLDQLKNQRLAGALYCICRKPQVQSDDRQPREAACSS